MVFRNLAQSLRGTDEGTRALIERYVGVLEEVSYAPYRRKLADTYARIIQSQLHPANRKHGVTPVYERLAQEIRIEADTVGSGPLLIASFVHVADELRMSVNRDLADLVSSYLAESETKGRGSKQGFYLQGIAAHLLRDLQRFAEDSAAANGEEAAPMPKPWVPPSLA